SSALCHTGQISHQLGKSVHQGDVREAIKSDKLLSERYVAMEEHLAANGVDLNAETISLGPMLKLNPDTERFEGNGDLDAAANALARPKYREPYVVPEVGAPA
ncbi:MAG: gfo/Idh/MocA family oxidoreductase, partial [Akkermansiaceae bacterium]|nr:gfo/Idh/MocA family oxidoreductase [Akkermansiaceae bacterium]